MPTNTLPKHRAGRQLIHAQTPTIIARSLGNTVSSSSTHSNTTNSWGKKAAPKTMRQIIKLNLMTRVSIPSGDGCAYYAMQSMHVRHACMLNAKVFNRTKHCGRRSNGGGCGVWAIGSFLCTMVGARQARLHVFKRQNLCVVCVLALRRIKLLSGRPNASVFFRSTF